MHRQIAGKLTGRVTKWIVLVVWLVILVVVGGVRGRSSPTSRTTRRRPGCPSSAESTRALDKLEPFQDPNAIPTVVVYERDVRAHRRRPGRRSRRRSRSSRGRLRRRRQPGEVSRARSRLRGRRGRADDGDLQLRQERLERHAGRRRRAARHRGDRRRDRSTSPGRAARPPTPPRPSRASTAPCCSPRSRVVIVILLITYRSPVLWMLPIISAGGRADRRRRRSSTSLAKYADLTVNGQSQGILTVLVIGAGTDYALLLVARYREELRRHEDRHEAMAFALHRAAPAILASAATVVRRHALPAVRRDELHRRARPGRRDRHRRSRCWS